MLFYCSSFDSFSLTLCTFKHRKGICTYLSSYLPRLHNKLGYVRLSRNLYIDYVHLSRNLHLHYIRLGRYLYIHYVRFRPSFISQFHPNWASEDFYINFVYLFSMRYLWNFPRLGWVSKVVFNFTDIFQDVTISIWGRKLMFTNKAIDSLSNATSFKLYICLFLLRKIT